MIKEVNSKAVVALGKLGEGDYISVYSGGTVEMYKVVESKDTVSCVFEIIKDIERDTNQSVLRNDILLKAAFSGLYYDETIKAIDKLRNDGFIYDPNLDKEYKVV